MNKILYIHGFGSNSNSMKGKLLKNHFGQDVIFTPTLPINPPEAVEFLKNILSSGNYKLIVASSLGGFYALYLAQFFNIKTILINPSLEPQNTIGRFVGTKQIFNDGTEFFVSQNYINNLAEIRNQINYTSLDNKKLHFYLSTDDELIDHSQIPQIFPNADIKFFNNCQHRFICFDSILPQIETLFKSLKD